LYGSAIHFANGNLLWTNMAAARKKTVEISGSILTHRQSVSKFPFVPIRLTQEDWTKCTAD